MISDIAKIAATYHAWRGDKDAGGNAYEDVPGFCKSATLDEIRSMATYSRPGVTSVRQS